MSEATQWKPQIDKAVATCGRKLSAEQKEDLRQDCYLKILEKIQTIARIEEKGEDEARKYVYRLAHNRCLDFLRADRREKNAIIPIGAGHSTLSMSAGSVALDEVGFDLDKVIDFGVSRTDLDQAISRLPVDEQLIIRGLFFEGESERAIGEKVSRSQHWTRNRKENALRALRRELTRKRPIPTSC